MAQPTTESLITANVATQVFPGSTDVPPQAYRFVNGVGGSGAFDVSYDGGTTYKLAPGSTAPFAEDIPNITARVAPSQVWIRPNGATPLSNLVVKALWG